MIWWKPRPSTPSTASSPSVTPSSTTSRVSEECQPIFCSGAPNESPGVPAGTTNVVIPRCPPSGSVFAPTTRTSARPALVMYILRPSSTQPSSVRRARAVMPATSEPAPGSVTAIAAMASPAASAATQRSCWSVVPWRTRWGAAM